MPAMTGKPSIGRPRNPGTEAERAEAMRARVRVNVQVFRKRQREVGCSDTDQCQPGPRTNLPA